MGLLNDLWWLTGVVPAMPLFVVGVEFAGDGDWPMAALFLALAAVVLLLPEYVRRRLFGSAESRLGAVPLVGRRFD